MAFGVDYGWKPVAKAPTSATKYNPANQAEFASNGPLDAAVGDARAAGLGYGDALNAYAGDRYQAYTGTGAYGTQPTPPGGPTAPRGPGGPGGYSSASSAAQNALKTLWAYYNKPADQTLSNKIAELVGQARGTGNAALDQLRAGLAGQENPYSMVQMPRMGVASNPLAQYMQAGGVSTSGVDALQQMLGSYANQSRQADTAMQDRMTQAWGAMQQGQLAGVDQQRAQFEQALGNQQAGLQFAEQQRQQQAREQLMMQILQMAVSSGTDLSKIGIKF